MKDTHMKTLLENQRRFFSSQRTKEVTFRREMLERLRDGVEVYEGRITEALFQDLRKSPYEVYISEIGMVKTELKMHLRHLKSWGKPERVKTPFTLIGSSSSIRREPYGLVLIISPWNYPFNLLIMPLIGAIASGNCVVLKPSNHSPRTAAIIEQMIRECFNEEYITIFQGGKEMNQALLRQPFDYIFFSGSPSLGKIVMLAASQHLTPVTLELGGKNPCIVDKEAELERAASRIAWGKFLNAGQSCLAPDYLLVESSVKNALFSALRLSTEKFFGKNPAESPDFARIVNERHFKRLQGLIRCGSIVFGGEMNDKDMYISPTLIDSVMPEDPIMQEEIFGPLLPVLEYEDIEDALSFVNSRPRPLSLYVFSEKRKTQHLVLERTSFGGGCINDAVIQFANLNLPFGGIGNSGMGAYHGRASFETFSHQKSVMKGPRLLDVKLRYPPYKGKLKRLKMILR